MRKIIIIFLLLISTLPAVVAQDLAAYIHTDQQVYVAGENVWLDGRVTGVNLPRYIQVQLVDRQGQAAAKLKLLLSGDRFSGYCELPGNLQSDYYFFDAYSSGRSMETELAPVMIINPLKPPATCTIRELQPAQSVALVKELPVTLNKTSFTNRDQVQVSLPALDSTGFISINVVRKDRVSDYADSLIRMNPRRLRHPASGLPETEGHHFLVTVKRADGTPMPGVRVFAAIMGDQAKITTGLSNANGEMEGILPLVYGDSKIVLSLEPGADSSLRLELADAGLPEQAVEFPCLQPDTSWQHDLESRLLNVKVGRAYDTGPLRQYLLEGADTTDFYGRPDAHYNLDDYTRFPDMKEILLEFVPEARVRNGEGADPVIEVLNAPTKGFFGKNGLILLDGIPVRDMQQLLSLNPLLLQSIDVVSRKYFLGSLAIEGILQYKSYKSDLAGYTLPVQDIIYPFQGVQIPAQPEFPEYQKDTFSHFPDFRNLLYRQISVAGKSGMSSAFKFYTSDATGIYEVIVSGYDGKGRPVLGRTIFQVQ
jgi:hypothetical protein